MPHVEARPVPPDIARDIENSLATVRELLSNLRFGSISLIVHEGRVVQLDVTEKKRLNLG